MWLQRFGASCGVLLGPAIALPGAVEAFTGETSATSLVLGVGVALAAPAATALYLHQRDRTGAFGRAAFAVHLLGLGLFTGVAFALNVVLFSLDPATVAAVKAGRPGRCCWFPRRCSLPETFASRFPCCGPGRFRSCRRPGTALPSRCSPHWPRWTTRRGRAWSTWRPGFP
ncbi:hypothetical protein ACQP00_27575 [Dactylosporangium sp. CS-047395]|uniref:hypothetical protein n=1 Tax=Dactylosporangium sp. CS-047395 TaxID=3239936 RepID=UPI003D8C31E3